MTENDRWGLACKRCGANIYVPEVDKPSDPNAANGAVEQHRLECPKRKLTVEVPA